MGRVIHPKVHVNGSVGEFRHLIDHDILLRKGKGYIQLQSDQHQEHRHPKEQHGDSPAEQVHPLLLIPLFLYGVKGGSGFPGRFQGKGPGKGGVKPPAPGTVCQVLLHRSAALWGTAAVTVGGQQIFDHNAGQGHVVSSFPAISSPKTLSSAW